MNYRRISEHVAESIDYTYLISENVLQNIIYRTKVVLFDTVKVVV